MTDLERFFERLVRNVIAMDPKRVNQPIPVLDIKTQILPYRTSRRALALESNDEYEELLIRLVGEEGNFVKTEPPEVAEWCQRQVASLTPDLSGIPGQAGATVSINPDAMVAAFGAEAVSDLAKAGPDGPSGGALALPPETCPHCDSKLPRERAINFCQACGRSVIMVPCDHCGADMEPGWRFCVSCGQETSETSQTVH